MASGRRHHRQIEQELDPIRAALLCVTCVGCLLPLQAGPHRQHVLQRHGFLLRIKIRERTLREELKDSMVNPVDVPFVDCDTDERGREAPAGGLHIVFVCLVDTP